KPILSYLSTGELPTNDKAARRIIFESENYFIQNEILYHLYRRKSSKASAVAYPITEQMVIPLSLRVEVMRQFHDNGHRNHERTYQSINTKYYWATLYRDVRKYVRSCNFCQKTNPATHPKRIHLKPWEIEGVWDRIHTDILGP